MGARGNGRNGCTGICVDELKVPPGVAAANLYGETLWLLPQKAAFWPARHTLLVADVHFGKAAAFRALGQPVPRGTTQANLRRLDAMLALLALHGTPVKRLIFLGDFLHARHGRHADVLAALAQWRARHADLHCVLVRGNHDQHAGDPPADLAIEVVAEPLLEPPFAWCHENDTPVPAGFYAVGGHLHPAFVLTGRAHERVRLACFCFDPTRGLLPAFGEFTGHCTVEQQTGRKLWVAAGDQVFAIPPQR